VSPPDRHLTFENQRRAGWLRGSLRRRRWRLTTIRGASPLVFQGNCGVGIRPADSDHMLTRTSGISASMSIARP